jgi:hypothetical protein
MRQGINMGRKVWAMWGGRSGFQKGGRKDGGLTPTPLQRDPYALSG